MFQSHRNNLQTKTPILDFLKDPLIYAVLWQRSITKDQPHFPYEYDQCMVYFLTFPTEISTTVGKKYHSHGSHGFGPCSLFASITKDLVEQTTPVATTIEDAGLTVSEVRSDFFALKRLGFFSERNTVNLTLPEANIAHEHLHLSW